MRTIKLIFIFLIGMISLMNVSCSNENEQKQEKKNSLYRKAEFKELTVEDDYYKMFESYSNHLLGKFIATDENGNSLWTNPSLDELQLYFNENYAETNRPRIICHDHSMSDPNMHYVTVLTDRGDYVVVSVDTYYKPPRVKKYNFGSYNPCGHVYE